jgi:cytochrome P450
MQCTQSTGRSMQSTQSTGSGLSSFDPQQWLSGDRKTVTLNRDAHNLSFGVGPRRCVGQSLATIEILTARAILAREVQSIEMLSDEMDLDFFLFEHPTGQPLRLVARK